MKDTGISLLEFKFDEEYDENLMGGFLSAIYNFGDESCDDTLSKISLEGDNMRISSINYQYNKEISLIAVGILSQVVQEDKFKEFAEKMLNRFCKEYEKDLLQFHGETSKFLPFKEYLKEQIDNYFGNQPLEFEKKLDDIFEKFQKGDLSGLDELDETFKNLVDD